MTLQGIILEKEMEPVYLVVKCYKLFFLCAYLYSLRCAPGEEKKKKMEGEEVISSRVAMYALSG